MPASNNALWAFIYKNYLKCVIRSRHSLGTGYNYPKCVGFSQPTLGSYNKDRKCVGFVDSLQMGSFANCLNCGALTCHTLGSNRHTLGSSRNYPKSAGSSGFG